MENALELENVCKRYDDFELKQVSFALPMGSIMGFIGENGAGKTTTIKAILNLIRLDSGEISLLGKDHLREERDAKRDVGVVLDHCCFHTDFRAGDVERILRNIYPNWDGALYAEFLERFRLPKAKRIKEYSKGMAVKLSFAAALSHRPRLLILDEATSGLDPVVRNEILDLLMEFIQDEEHSVLLSSHITSDLERAADYITFLHRGNVVFSRQKDELLYGYGLLKCGKEEFSRVDRSLLEGIRESSFGVEALVRDRAAFQAANRSLLVDSVTLEDIMVFHGREKEEQQ